MKYFSVSIHDVAPDTWSECEQLLALTDALRIPVTLLVVPEYHGGTRADEDRRFARSIRRRVTGGDEVVLHGLRHLDDGPVPRGPLEWLRRRIYTASEGEFDALDADEAERRLRRGAARLARAGLHPTGFIAPAWLMGPGCRTALGRAHIDYTSTRTELIDVASGRIVPAPSLVYSTRSAWRRAASRLVNARRLRQLYGAPLVRAALHPADARYSEVMRSWRELLRALADDRRPVIERLALSAAYPTAPLPRAATAPAAGWSRVA